MIDYHTPFAVHTSLISSSASQPHKCESRELSCVVWGGVFGPHQTHLAQSSVRSSLVDIHTYTRTHTLARRIRLLSTSASRVHSGLIRAETYTDILFIPREDRSDKRANDEYESTVCRRVCACVCVCLCQFEFECRQRALLHMRIICRWLLCARACIFVCLCNMEMRCFCVLNHIQTCMCMGVYVATHTSEQTRGIQHRHLDGKVEHTTHRQAVRTEINSRVLIVAA